MSSESIADKYAPPNARAVSWGHDAASMLTQEEAWAAIIGSTNTRGYVQRFQSLSLGGGAAWHWPAFLTTLPWLMYRKMWIGALVYLVAPAPVLFGLLMMFRPFAPVVVLAWWLGLALLPGVMANRWYFQHCKSRIRDVRARGGSKEQMVARLEAAGGTNTVVVVVFGLLFSAAATVIAIPTYQMLTITPRIDEALHAGYDVAAVVGRQYEQTGAMPSSAEVHAIAARIPHPSTALRSIDIEPSGALILDVQASSSVAGKLRLVPEVEDRHVYWTCTTDDLKAYAPHTCRSSASSDR